MPRKRSVRLLERRETPRRSVLYPAYLLFMRRRFRCRLVEIGTSGICPTGAPVLKPGTPIMVETMLLGRPAGVVAHRTGHRLGGALFGPPLQMDTDDESRSVDEAALGNSDPAD